MSRIEPLDPARLQPAGLAAAMRDLEPVLMALGIDFYMVGAVARDIWLTQAGGTSHRMTTDVDLAISIADDGQYEEVIRALTQTERFHATRASGFALIHSSTSTVVDLMPFGTIADADGTVRIASSGLERYQPSASPRWPPEPSSCP